MKVLYCKTPPYDKILHPFISHSMKAWQNHVHAIGKKFEKKLFYLIADNNFYHLFSEFIIDFFSFSLFIYLSLFSLQILFSIYNFQFKRIKMLPFKAFLFYSISFLLFILFLISVYKILNDFIWILSTTLFYTKQCVRPHSIIYGKLRHFS